MNVTGSDHQGTFCVNSTSAAAAAGRQATRAATSAAGAPAFHRNTGHSLRNGKLAGSIKNSWILGKSARNKVKNSNY